MFDLPSPKCSCAADDHARYPTHLCREHLDPPMLCNCVGTSQIYTLCPQPWQPCPAPCTQRTWTVNAVQFSCAAFDYDQYVLRGTPKAGCTGYSAFDAWSHRNEPDYVPAPLNGTYNCDACRATPAESADDRAKHYRYPAHPGAVCIGYSHNGDEVHGHITCEPK